MAFKIERHSLTPKRSISLRSQGVRSSLWTKAKKKLFYSPMLIETSFSFFDMQSDVQRESFTVLSIYLNTKH